MDWIDEQLHKRRLPRRRLVEAIPGMTEVMFSKVMHGQRRLSADEAAAIYRFFGYRVPSDPTATQLDAIEDEIMRLSDAQLQQVALYLEALTGHKPGD